MTLTYYSPWSNPTLWDEENPNADFFLPTALGAMSCVRVNGQWVERLSKLFSWLWSFRRFLSLSPWKCLSIGLYFILVFYYCWRPMQCISNILVISHYIVFQSKITISTTITLPWHKWTILCNVYTSGVTFSFPLIHAQTQTFQWLHAYMTFCWFAC